MGVEVLDHPWAAARRRCTDKVDEEDLRKFEVFAQALCLRRALLWMVARSLKPEDREKLESKFEALDNHHHGVITLQEFQQYLSDKCGSNPSYAKALFQHLDVYRSGEITYSSFWLPLWRIRVGFRRMLCAQPLKNSTLMGVVRSPRTKFGRFLETTLMVTACKTYCAVLNLIMRTQSRLRNSKRICTSQIRTRTLIFSVFLHVAGHGRIANVYCICSTLCMSRCCEPK